MQSSFTTVEQYISQFSAEIQRILQQARETVRTAAPDAAESIAYQMPAYKLGGKPLVYFAAHTVHLGFYPIPSGIEAFKNELSAYKQSGKGTVQFPYSKQLPVELIKRIVEFRVAEVNKMLKK